LAKLAGPKDPGPDIVAAFESETDVTTAGLFKADAKTEVVESFERSKPLRTSKRAGGSGGGGGGSRGAVAVIAEPAMEECAVEAVAEAATIGEAAAVSLETEIIGEDVEEVWEVD